MKRVRYGIIGFGRFADKAIAPAIQQSHNSELVALQKRSLVKAKESAAVHGVPLAFDSAAELVAHPDVDAVFIVSANALHCEETLLAANAGKHVLCEKPAAMNVGECERMIDACARHRVKFMVGHMLRLSPALGKVKGYVQSGALGKIIRAEANFVYDSRLSSRAWLTDRTIAGGGPVFDVGVHCLDTLRFVLDDEVVSVKGELSPEPDAERTEVSAQLVLRFSRDTIGSIYCSYDSAVRESYLEIAGTEARMSVVDFTVGDRRATLTMEKRTDANSPETITEEIEVPNLYIEEVNAMSTAILTNTEPLLSGKNALMNQRVLDAALHR